MRLPPGSCLLSATLLLALTLSGCDSPELSGQRAAQLAQRNAILSEPPGDYFIGRRYFNPNYKFWGYVRRPGQPWRTAQLVMFNEKQKLAPDREENQLGADNNYQYRLYGRFTGDQVYEPMSNHVLPEFFLTGAEVTDRNPPSIFPPDVHLPDTVIMQPD